MAEQYRRNYEDDYRRGGRRGWSDRAGDEVRSWFGDDEAQARRSRDERDDRYSGGDRERGWREQGDGWRSRGWRGEGDYGSDSGYGRGYGAGPSYERGGYGRDWDDDSSRGYGRRGERGGESRWGGWGSDEDRGGYGGEYRSRGSRGQGYGGSMSGSEGERGGWSGSDSGRGSDWGRGESGRGERRASYWGRGMSDSSGRERDYGGEEYGGYRPSWRGAGQGGSWEGQRESFAGRGPKDYKRSDSRIEEEISDRLTDDPEIDASEISIQVQNGEVTLSGTVDSREQKRRAEDLAESISGVNEVTNNLRTNKQGQHQQQSQQQGGNSKTSRQSTTTGARS